MTASHKLSTLKSILAEWWIRELRLIDSHIIVGSLSDIICIEIIARLNYFRYDENPSHLPFIKTELRQMIDGSETHFDLLQSIVLDLRIIPLEYGIFIATRKAFYCSLYWHEILTPTPAPVAPTKVAV